MKDLLKRAALLTLVVSLSVISFPADAEHANLDDTDVTAQVNVRAFLAGEDGNVGAFVYIVDRTAGLCFASLRISQGVGSGMGLTVVDCKRLTKIPTIAYFIKTGKLR